MGLDSKNEPYKVAILWRGDRAKRAAATPQNNRYHRIFEELEAHGIHAEPAVFAEDLVDEVEKQLMAVDGVLVWVNPIDDGLTRDKLDPMLRDVASKGPWVSAHPDAILKMGVRAVQAAAHPPGSRYHQLGRLVRNRYSHPRSPNSERSTPGGAYHPLES